MNMAPAIEFWSHCLGHFVSVLHCRVCACGSYGGGDVHKGGGGGGEDDSRSVSTTPSTGRGAGRLDTRYWQ